MSGEAGNKPVVPQGSFWRTVKVVSWSFLGIRKHSASQEDVAKLNPFHIIAVGIVAVLFFVASLIALVNWVVAK
jgi:hypothetical protein